MKERKHEYFLFVYLTLLSLPYHNMFCLFLCLQMVLLSVYAQICRVCQFFFFFLSYKTFNRQHEGHSGRWCQFCLKNENLFFLYFIIFNKTQVF